jgi:hypothetical protein
VLILVAALDELSTEPLCSDGWIEEAMVAAGLPPDGRDR